MTKLRENTGVVLWILVFAFGVIWVLQDSGGLETVGMERQDGNIAMVNGVGITQQEYQDAMDAQRQQYRAQTGQDLSIQEQEQLRGNVFDALVEDRIRKRQMERLGITVTDDELEEMVLGEDPHPIIRTYFGDDEGNVNRNLLLSFVNNPEARQDWLQMEDFLRAQRREEKLDNLLNATVHVSTSAVEHTYWRRNVQMDVEYLALPYSDTPAADIEVTDDDLRTYYNENREEFSRPRTYEVEYVTISRAPTPEDTAQVVEELEALRADFEAADDDSVFVQQSASQRPYSGEFQTPNQMNPEMASAVFSDPTPGRVLGPLFSADMAHLIKIQDVQPAADTYLRARHILIDQEGAAASEQAENVLAQIQEGADFAEMARQYSDGPTGSDGGNLGWFNANQMDQAFSQAALNAPIGEVVGPVQTDFGLHLIQVQDRTDQAVQIADIAYDLRPSPATLSQAEDRLGDVSYYAEDGDFQSEAERENLEVQSTILEAGQETIPGVGRSPLIPQFLNRSSEGTVSDVIELQETFAVLHVANIDEEGYRPFEEVQNEIRPRVEQQKRLAQQRARLQEALDQAGSLEGAADQLGVELVSYTGLMHDTDDLPLIGRDRKFVGTAFGLSEGRTSRVVEGNNAAFALRVTSIEEPEPMGASTRQQIRQELEQQRRLEVRNRWISELREEADIDDRRTAREL